MSTIFDAGRNGPARTLRVRSEAIAEVNGEAILEPVRLSGREGVNSLFEYELLLKTTTAFIGAASTAELNLDSLLGREISCSIALDGVGQFIAGAVGGAPGHLGAGVREFNALVARAAFAGQQGRHTLYRLSLRPWLHLASLSTDCKVFQNKTAVEVLDELLADYSFPVEKRLYGLESAAPRYYPQRDYQVQYNESDFEFFERLCQEWGISYHFEHGDGKHRLVLSDAMASFHQNPSAAYQEVEFHPPGWKVDAEYIHRFESTHELTSGQYSTRDYDYTQPRADLSAARTQARPTARADAEVYQWHASQGGSHYAQPRAGAATGTGGDARESNAHEQGRHLALLRMQALRTQGHRAQASGNLRAMVPGCTFRLRQHPQAQANAEYLILDTTFLIEDVGQASQGDAGSADAAIAAAITSATAPQHWRVQVEFTAHPVNETLRPALARIKPHTRGPQTALVVGPEGQNIWTDELGRIKVQFPWDRLGSRNEHSSCWLRVSSPWAGNQLGGVHIPRIGQEVIVDFIGGDPDLPICTGRVHNQLNLPPWSLPRQSALSGFRSRELTKEGGNSAAGRSNHLILDDTEGKIQAQLKSDHQHSELNLGHIGRIEGNAGRTQDRGEGAELRTDGHGVVRAAKGLYVGTDGREKAQGHVKDLTEPVQRLSQARDQHETLANLAEYHNAQDKGEDQNAVSEQIKAQNEAIRGDGSQGAPFPELSEPHLVLSSPAGIQAATSGSTHIASDQHTAITSGAHTSIASSKSLLASALEAIRLFAHKAGIRLFAAKGPVQVQAQDDLIELVAKKAIELISTTDWIRLKAKQGISFEADTSSFVISGHGFVFHTPGVHHVWSGDDQTFGPKALVPVMPKLPESICLPCLLDAANAGNAIAKL